MKRRKTVTLPGNAVVSTLALADILDVVAPAVVPALALGAYSGENGG